MNRFWRAAMLIAASALVLAGCGGGGNGGLLYGGGDGNGGRSDEYMARIAALEEAAMAAQEAADTAMMDAATAREEAHAAEAAAAAAQVEAEAADRRAVGAGGTARATGIRAEIAEEATGELQAQLDRHAASVAQYDPTDPGGTLEGAAGRAVAARLAAAIATGAWPGASYPRARGRRFGAAAIRDLRGRAVYSGVATGRYATRAVAGHEAKSGRFTAFATITATFHAGGLEVTDSRIDDFLDRGGAMDMSGWAVHLNGAHLTAAGTVSGAATALTDGRLSYGVWEARFHGDDHQIHPTGLVGRFKAVGGTAQPVLTTEGRIDKFLDSGLGVVVGSFGAQQR